MGTRNFSWGLLVCVVLGFGIAGGAARGTGEEDKPTGSSEEAYADLMASEVLDLQDLAQGAEIQRRMFNHMTPSGFSWLQPMFPSVAPFDAKYFDETFLDGLLGEDTNSVAVYPLSLVLDPKTRETLVYNAGGELIASVPSDGVSRTWPEDSDPARVTLQLDLLPTEDVEPYLYVGDRIAESLASVASELEQLPRSGEITLKSLTTGQFGFSSAQRQTNGNFRLTVTNGTDVAEVFSYTVWHNSSVVVATWTNEESNAITSTNLIWNPTSPPFNGLESEWEVGITNLGLTNGVGAWEDSGISTNARVRFYGVAKYADTDGDGLTDGEEIFLHRTDPENPDSDFDGSGDGPEVVNGSALDPGVYPLDTDLEGILASLNTAQIGYLSYLTGNSFTYDSGTNYAQRIEQLRDALEDLAGSFLDLDVNTGGVLAEQSNVVTWTLATVLDSTGNSSGDWLGGVSSTTQVEEIEAVLDKLTHLVGEGAEVEGYSYQAAAYNEGPVQIGSDWDLGTGYPTNWPTNQTIKTYLVLDTMEEIPEVGPGTVDDWIQVNGGSARFPGSGEIYTGHVADITSVWDPDGTNSLSLWDCGSCAGSNNYTYLSPFSVVWVLETPLIQIDLDIDSDYDGDVDTVDDSTETYNGGAIGINSDDDDWDNNVDRDESGSISGEDDLEKITLNVEPFLPSGTVKLETVYTGVGRIAIWEGSNKTTSVSLTNTWDYSTDTVPSNLWIEGISPSTNGARDVELHLSYENGGFACTDTVAVTVCELFYGAFGHGARTIVSSWPFDKTEYESFTNYVASKGAVLRNAEYILIRNSSSSFLVRIANTDDDYKAALQTDDAYIGLMAHANSGLGPAFDTNLTCIADFFNVGATVAAVDYKWLLGNYPMSIPDAAIPNGVTNYTTAELGYERFPNLAYTYPPPGWPAISNDVAVGYIFATNYYAVGTQKFHYYGDDNDEKYTDPNFPLGYLGPCPTTNLVALLVTAGSDDRPSLKYKKLFLNQCRSGRHFSGVFNQVDTVLFYNTDDESMPQFLQYIMPIYLDAILDNKSNADIEAELDGGLGGDIYSYKEF